MRKTEWVDPADVAPDQASAIFKRKVLHFADWRANNPRAPAVEFDGGARLGVFFRDDNPVGFRLDGLHFVRTADNILDVEPDDAAFWNKLQREPDV